ncbi:MAG: F0F1 ATP synthase subunit epsilon [Patescibacteria group bacterium]
MKLSVYSLKKVLFQGEARLLNVKTFSGEITVLDNHETLITVLSAGTMKVVDNKNGEHFFPINSGFLEVRENNEVRCIVEE